MAGPTMQKVSTLVSKDISNYLINQQTWGGILFNVKAYGAEGDGTTDDTADIQSAISAAVSNGGGIVFFPEGTYLTSSELAVTDSIYFWGSGQDVTFVKTTSTTANVFKVDADYVKFFDMTIQRLSIATAGSAIKLNTGVQAVIERVTISDNHYYGVESESASSWTLRNCYIFNAIKYGVYVKNVALPDTGDQVIDGCTLDSSTGTEVAIRHESGGGLKIYGNKILRHGIGYDLQIADGATTSICVIDGNSIEMQTARHIRLGRLGTTGVYSQIIITNNQHNFTTSITEGYVIAAGIDSVVISGNMTNGYSSATYVNITGGADINIDGNQINGWQIGTDVVAGINGVRVGPNSYKSVGKPIEDNTLATSGTRPPLVDHLYIKKFTAVTSDSVYTNLFRIDMQAFRSCTFELTFEGILAGVDGIGRHIKQIIARDAGDASETGITDTNAGAVFDVQFDNTTTTGSVIIGLRRNTAAGGTQLDGTATIRMTGHVQGMNIL